MNPLSANIKGLLKAKGLTIKQLADSANLPESTIYNILNRGSGHHSKIESIALALGVSSSELLNSNIDTSKTVESSKKMDSLEALLKSKDDQIADLRRTNEFLQRLLMDKLNRIEEGVLGGKLKAVPDEAGVRIIPLRAV